MDLERSLKSRNPLLNDISSITGVPTLEILSAASEIARSPKFRINDYQPQHYL